MKELLYDQMKTIKVYGMAKKIIVPDELYFSISLSEYDESGHAVTMEELEFELLEIAKWAGIPSENIEIETMSGFKYGVQSSDPLLQDNDALKLGVCKSYLLKTDSLDSINKLTKGLNKKATNSISLVGSAHSSIKTIMQELKRKALRNAKGEAKNILAIEDVEPIEIVNVEMLPDKKAIDLYAINYGETYSTTKNGNAIAIKHIPLICEMWVTFAFD